MTPGTASDRRALLADRVDEALEEQHQLLAGAGSQAGGNKLLIVDQMSATIAQHAGNRIACSSGSQLGFCHHADIFLPQLDPRSSMPFVSSRSVRCMRA